MGAKIALSLVASALLLAGCGHTPRVREASPADRCAELMQQAFPGGDIRITRKDQVTDAPTQSVAAIVVAVEGERRKLPEGSALLRNLAVECRFNDNILTGFRWTAGPLR